MFEMLQEQAIQLHRYIDRILRVSRISPELEKELDMAETWLFELEREMIMLAYAGEGQP